MDAIDRAERDFALRPTRRPSIGGSEWIAILILIALIFI
jgi:hypothetical protein